MADCRNTLSYLQEVFQPAAGTCQEPRSLLLTSSVVPCSNILNLGWSLYIFFCLFFPLTLFQTLQHSNDEQWFLSQSDKGPGVALSQTGTPPFPSHSLIHMHCLHGRQTHSCHTVSARQKASHRPTPPWSSQLTVKFWVSRAGLSLHPSCLLTHITNEKRDKRDFHIKGWKAHLQRLKRPAALGSPEYTHTHTDAQLAQTRKSFFNNFICPVLHGSHQHLLCVRLHHSFKPPFNQLHCMLYVLCSVHVPSQCSRSQQSCLV